MTMGICGCGWVTPAGRGLDPVWAAIRAGIQPEATKVSNPLTGRIFPVFTATDIAPELARQPRLRRASTISHLVVTAILDALADAGIDPAAAPDRLALVFAAADGGVVYTRKFFAEIAANGVQAGSPLLFPETVYNAPLSHAAASLGVTGTATTLVGDATASLSALATAEDLLASGECDFCVVAAAEESDWIICEAYARWGLATSDDTIRPFAGRGTIFAEGAAAIVLGSNGNGWLTIHPGRSYRAVADGRDHLASVLGGLFRPDSAPSAVFASAAGTRFDAIERHAFDRMLPEAEVFTPKITLGESFTAASLAQVICARFWLRENPAASAAIVSVVGLHGQLAALRLDREPVTNSFA